MVRRSTPQSQIDERYYPLRMLILVPRNGFSGFEAAGHGNIHIWLDREVGRGHYAIHAGGRQPGIEIRDRVALYFRHPEPAARFLAAFPALELADRTEDDTYTSPIRREPRP